MAATSDLQNTDRGDLFFVGADNTVPPFCSRLKSLQSASDSDRRKFAFLHDPDLKEIQCSCTEPATMNLHARMEPPDEL
jgi:hypothetical protein